MIFAAFDGKVQAVSTRDGKPLWTYHAKLAVPGDVVVADGRVLVGSRTYDLIALDAATGRELWKRCYWFSWIESPPIVRDGVIYTGSSDATNVYAAGSEGQVIRVAARRMTGRGSLRHCDSRELHEICLIDRNITQS